MCNKCLNYHSGFYEDHPVININKIENEEIFTGCCQEENHNNNKFDYFCRNHNQLCCDSCICRIQGQKKR